MPVTLRIGSHLCDRHFVRVSIKSFQQCAGTHQNDLLSILIWNGLMTHSNHYKQGYEKNRAHSYNTIELVQINVGPL